MFSEVKNWQGKSNYEKLRTYKSMKGISGFCASYYYCEKKII